MFIHFGIYTLLGKGEWVMHGEEIPISEYEKLCLEFNPIKFKAGDWVNLAKECGAKYITITTKHHDGFCVYESKLTNYNIVKRTPFARDLIKEMADECHRQEIKIFFYYSLLDWHHPDYYPLGQTKKYKGRKKDGIWENYLRYYLGQVEELGKNYGEIGGFWFDGFWDKSDANWGLQELYNIIHKLQPEALIGNNHHLAPFEGENFQTFEQDLPGENTFGLSPDVPISSLPLETSLTINKSWGYNKNDNEHKSPEELIEFLKKVNSKNANFLLNTGPLPDGTIQKEHRERFLEVGKYLRSEKYR